MSGQYWKKRFEQPNSLNVFLTKYDGSLNNASQTNGDFREQIFARDCNNSGGTEMLLWKVYSFLHIQAASETVILSSFGFLPQKGRIGGEDGTSAKENVGKVGFRLELVLQLKTAALSHDWMANPVMA